MKPIFKLSLVTASMLVATGAMAASPSNAQLQREIRAIAEHSQQLQHEVKMLKTQLRAQNHVHRSTSSVALKTTNRSRHILTDRFDHSITVTTSPYMGEKTTGDASDIVEQYSKSNLQLTMLEQRDALMKQLHVEGSNLWRPIIELSGGIEGQLFGINGYGRGSNPAGINLATAELDVGAAISPWVGGFVALDYNDTPDAQGSRETKGTLYLRDGFATIGNLNRFPLYFTIGKLRVPFGRYSSLMLTAPVTQTLGDTRSTSAILGMATHGFYGSVFGFTGNQTSGGKNIFKQGGANVGYKSKFGADNKDSVELGASVTSNLADSNGLQSTGATNSSAFQGFAATTSSNNIVRRVPALSVYGSMGWHGLTAIAEYISAVRSFNKTDLSYGSSSVAGGNAGATPKALHLELNYTIHVMNRPLTFGADYGHTWQALGVNDPQQSLTADVQTSWFRNTLETLEYRRDYDYGKNDYAAGRGTNDTPVAPVAGTGKTRNSYIAQLGVYF